MKSSDTVTDGSSKELTIEKCASREGKRQEKEKERGDRKNKNADDVVFIFSLLA